MLQRLCRGLAKILYYAIWKAIGRFARKPQIEVLYEDKDGSRVLRLHGGAYIEPLYGYIISAQGCLLDEPLFPNFSHYQKPLAIAVPSPFAFLRARRLPHRIIRKAAVVSLRHLWEWNYYHFYLDVLGKLELFRHAGVGSDLPLALAKYADEVPFVRPLIGRGAFRSCEWLVPTSEYVYAEDVIFGVTHRPYKARAQFILDALELHISPPYKQRRVFLNRSSNRRISNFAEVQPVLEKHEFEIVDTAAMSIDEQIALFEQIRYLVVIHGAGTTNILFRGEAPLSLLELHHEKYVNFDHKRLCDEIGYHWSHLEGKMGHGAVTLADFSVSPERLEEKIISLLQT